MAASRAELAMLYRRAGFGARPAELDVAERAGWDATVDRLLAAGSPAAASGAAGPGAAAGPDPGVAASPPPSLTSPAAYLSGVRRDPGRRRTLAGESRELALWWLDRMTVVRDPWPEKLAWFWHGHFATAIAKVRLPAWMLGQQESLRAYGSGPFGPLLTAMVSDPAMLSWLDGRTNRRQHANENFARECLELFALGHGNYTERDVRELARAFTGWSIAPDSGQARYLPARHDPGPVTVLGRTGPLDSPGAVTLLTGQPACPTFLAARAWSRFAVPVQPGDPATQPLVTALGAGLDLGAMWRALFTTEAFRTPAVASGLVKQPVEWVVGLLRALNLRAAQGPSALTALTALGQVPFNPPNVGGWPQNGAWLTTAAMWARLEFARTAVARGDLSIVTDAAPADRPDAVAHLLGIDRWSAPSAQALRAATGDPHRLAALAACSPEYLMA